MSQGSKNQEMEEKNAQERKGGLALLKDKGEFIIYLNTFDCEPEKAVQNPSPRWIGFYVCFFFSQLPCD